MAIHPTEIKDDGTIVVLHEEKGHSADIHIDDIKFIANNLNNKDDENFLAISCPVCPATSYHPVSGGSHPEMVQRLFAFKYAEEDRKKRKAKNRDFSKIKDKLNSAIDAQHGGPERNYIREKLDDDVNIVTSLANLARKQQQGVMKDIKVIGDEKVFNSKANL